MTFWAKLQKPLRRRRSNVLDHPGTSNCGESTLMTFRVIKTRRVWAKPVAVVTTEPSILTRSPFTRNTERSTRIQVGSMKMTALKPRMLSNRKWWIRVSRKTFWKRNKLTTKPFCFARGNVLCKAKMLCTRHCLIKFAKQTSNLQVSVVISCWLY